jgi:ABC-type multidrug transport system ATPase subunit
VSKKYSNFTLSKVSFSIKKQEFFGILGNNGCGKSTLINLLTGITKPDSGSIEINGGSVVKLCQQ